MGNLLAFTFFEADSQKRGLNYGIAVTLLKHLKKNISRFKVGTVPGMGVALEASQNVSKSIMSMTQGQQ